MNYFEILNDYTNDEYVYIIEGCDGIYVSPFEPEYTECSQCGMFPSIVDEGLVKDLLHQHVNKLIKYRVGQYKLDYNSLKIRKKINYRNR